VPGQRDLAVPGDLRPRPTRRRSERFCLACLLPHTNRYTLISDGIRNAVFYTKIYNRVGSISASDSTTPRTSSSRIAGLTASSSGSPSGRREAS